jgi:hypothetical protein
LAAANPQPFAQDARTQPIGPGSGANGERSLVKETISELTASVGQEDRKQ